MSEAERTVVKFGNGNPQMQTAQGPIKAPHLEQSVTDVVMWDGFDDPDQVKHTLSTPNDRVLTLIARSLPSAHKRYAVGLSEMEQIVAAHTGGEAPHWFWSSDPTFAKVLAKHFGVPVATKTQADGVDIVGPTALLVNSGRDTIHSTLWNSTFTFMGLANSSTATTPATSDTTLTGEITTAGGGLIRAAATYAHTNGTNTSTLTKTFTANGSDSLPVTVSQMAVFTAITSGTMVLKTALNANATLTISGDNVTVTETITLG